MSRSLRATLLALSLACLAGAVSAAERPTLTVADASSPIRLDGALDEPAWASAEAVGAFLLMIPREGQVPSESTLVRVLRDRDRLVFGMWCRSARKPHAGLAARDQILDGDHISVHLDTDGDGQRAYIFGVNPWGVQLDGILTVDPDFKWDGVWDAAARRGEGEWTAEISIPFRIMRISAEGRPWRLWVRREITAWNEVSTWPLYRAGEPGPIMLQAGDLAGLGDARGGRELTVEPYVFGARLGARDLGASEWTDEDASESGVDVQMALTRSLVANATYNPDFSQIEADALQISVNRRFPIIYPEKRPFFLEGADRFVTLMDLVLTRRMADPHWGAKLTGRAGAWNTAGLFVQDHGGSSLLGSGYTPTTDDRLTRPGWYSLARMQLPFGEGSNVGAIAGAHVQEPEDASLAVRELDTYNAFGGFDTQLRLSARWRTEAQLVGSASQMDSAGTGRPVEPFHDWMGVWRLFYRDKARQFQLGARHVGEKFRDELGYQDYAGVTYRRVGGWWDLFPRSGALQRVSPIFDVLVVHHHTGRLELTQIEGSMDFEFRRSAFVNAAYLHFDEHWLGRLYPQDRGRLFVEWHAWRPLTLQLDASAGDAIHYGSSSATSSLAWSEQAAFDAILRPGPRLTVASNVVRYRLTDGFQGEELEDLWLVGVKATAQFTRRLSLRVYPQYDSNASHLDVNTLLSYVVQPGSVFYLGLNGGYDEDAVIGERRATSRQAFVKISYRLAI